MKISSLRWWITGILVLASVLNYVDRTALAVAAKTIKDQLHLTDTQYGGITNAFLLAYTISYFLGGVITDRIGTRASFLISLCGWSVANMAHALARGFLDLAAFRFGLGLFEAIYFPAAMRGFTEWFRPVDRSKAVGLMLAGASFGAVIAPPLVSWMMGQPSLGWRGAFVITGAIGFVLVPVWLFLYRPPALHPYLTGAERDYLQLDAPSRTPARRASLPNLAEVLAYPASRVIIPARAITDASWYLLLFWLIKYLQSERGFSLQLVQYVAWIPFAAADVGAIFGGWLSSRLIAKGMPIVQARQRCMVGFALILPITLVAYFLPPNMSFVAVGLFSLGCFGHMAWGANSLTLHTDVFPPDRVATMMGVTGAAGSLAGAIASLVGGWLVDQAGGRHFPIFLLTGTLHPIAAAIIYFGLRSVKPYRAPDANLPGLPIS